MLDRMDPRSTAVRSSDRPESRPARSRRHSVPFAFAWPSIVLVLVFYFTPIIVGFVMAFTNWSSYSDRWRVIGFANFVSLWREGTLSSTLSVTLRFAAFFTIVSNAIALMLALLLERTNRLNSFFRTVLFIPVLISPLAAGYLFRGIFALDGPLNEVLSAVSFSEVRVEWLGSTTWTIFLVSVVQVWKSFGIYMLVYIAALSTVPEELIAAAKVDGASWWQLITHVKLPLIGQGFTFNVALALIGALQTFELVVAMTLGGPGTSTSVLNLLVWRTYGTGTFGYASAISMVLFVVVALLALPLIKFLRGREVDQ